MKRCPKCNRSFPDENQKFCTIDGGLLVADQPFDPNDTIQSSGASTGSGKEPPKPDFSATIATSSSAPTVVFPKNTGPTGSATSPKLHQQNQTASQPSVPPPAKEVVRPPVPSEPLPPAPASQPVAAATTAAAPKKKSKLPLILGILAILLVFGVGAVVAAFFLVIKPRLQPQASETPVVVANPQPENVNTNANTPATSSEAKPAESEFVAPPNTIQFTNSVAKLDGKLAEHYLDFSFYYPNNWQPNPKAGVAGSGNFAKVERRLPPDFTQENFAVRWYESKGTYDADLPSFPKQAEDFSASLARAFPGYRKVSEGPTKINSLDAYEFRWVGLSPGTEKGDLQLWGRVVFVPTGVEGDSNGAILTMFTTSLAPELSSVEDVGTRGEMPVILESFRFGKSR